MEAPKASCIGFISALLILTTSFQSAAAKYSTSPTACGIRSPGDATCAGLGTSTPADYAVTTLNTTTVYVYVDFNSVPGVGIVAAASISYINGIEAFLILDVIIGYIIFSSVLSVSVYLNVVQCPSLTTGISSNTGLVPNTQNLYFSDLYQALVFSKSVTTGACNVVPCALVTPSPSVQASVNGGPILSFDGVVTIYVRGASGSTQMVTDPTSNSSVSLTCTTQALTAAASTLLTSIQQSVSSAISGSSGDRICDTVTSIAALLNEISSTPVESTNVVIISPVNKVEVLIRAYTEVFCFYPLISSLLEAC